MVYYNTFNQILLFKRQNSKFKFITLFWMFFQKKLYRHSLFTFLKPSVDIWNFELPYILYIPIRRDIVTDLCAIIYMASRNACALFDKKILNLELMFPLAIWTLEKNLKLTLFQNEILFRKFDTKFQTTNCFVKKNNITFLTFDYKSKWLLNCYNLFS